MSINGAGNVEVEVLGVLRKYDKVEWEWREKVQREPTKYEATTEMIPPTPMAAKFPANIS